MLNIKIKFKKITKMENFETINKLGDGAYSVVYKVRRKQDNKIYALKKVKLKDLCDKEKQNALNEVRILASVKSNFVISYKEAFIDEDDSNLCLVMEYADKGDLYQKILQFKKIGCLIEEIDIWRIFIQMVKGLKSLHDLNIIHRDLKSSNIFLFADGTAKIGDLNVSKVINKGVGFTQTGTPYYASPEVWKDQPYDIKSDIWSLGCVTFEMLALRPPFRAENMDKLYNKVIKGEYGKISDRYSDDIKEIIKLLLKVNPKERPSCAQILNHELIKKRLEFFQAQTGFEDDLDTNDETVLLKTIKIPKNIIFLSEKLPGAKYNNDKCNNKLIKRNIRDENKNDLKVDNLNKELNHKNVSFTNNLLPFNRFNFTDKEAENLKINKKDNNRLNNNECQDNKRQENIKSNYIINKNEITEKNDSKVEINNNFKQIVKERTLDLNKDINKAKEKTSKPNFNINFSLIPVNRNINRDYINLKINRITKKQASNSRRNIFHKDNSKIDIMRNHIYNKSNRIKINSREKKDNSDSNLNSNLEYNNNIKKSKNQQDEFFKYLKSIGLGDIYKLCMPNYIENNSIKNYNNRYKLGIKKENILPNLHYLTNKNIEKEKLQENKNKIVPNKRLMPIRNNLN